MPQLLNASDRAYRAFVIYQLRVASQQYELDAKVESTDPDWLNHLKQKAQRARDLADKLEDETND